MMSTFGMKGLVEVGAGPAARRREGAELEPLEGDHTARADATTIPINRNVSDLNPLLSPP